MATTNIVIIGAGFGGVYTYNNLRRLDKNPNIKVTIISSTNYFLFTPLLHEVATGGLGYSNILTPIRNLLISGDDFYQADVLKIDLEDKTIDTSVGSLSFDVLVIATGATTNYYDVVGAKELTFPLKSLDDAINLRDRFIDQFERGIHIKDQHKRKKLLSFTVVGGGPTGVELVSEMSEYFFETFARLYAHSDNCDIKKDVTLTLVDSNFTLLKQYSSKISDVVHKRLTNLGINLLLGKSVKEITTDGIIFTDGSFHESGTTMWTAGVKSQVPELVGNVIFHNDRLIVNPKMQLEHYSNVFVLGDCACIGPSSTFTVPMLAQAATKGSVIVAKNILNYVQGEDVLNNFKFRSDGMLISLGQWMAVGDVKGRMLHGRFTWWLWRTIYLFKILTWPKRLKIALEWTINLFSERDISKL